MCFNKFYQSSIWIFDVGEMSACFAHIETLVVGTAVNRKREALRFAELTKFLHVGNVEAYLDETRVSPVASFENLARVTVQCNNKLNAAIAHKFGKCTLWLAR